MAHADSVLDSPPPSGPSVTRVELIRASSAASLLRVDVAAQTAPDQALLVVRDCGTPRRLTPLPSSARTTDALRLAFAIPSELREGRFSLQLAETEVPLHPDRERTREDAIATVQLARTRRRVAELEQALAANAAATPTTTASLAGTPRDPRLEQQLNEHRLLRAQLSRELEAARRRSQEVEQELQATRSLRETLELQLATEQAERAAEQERLTQAVEASRARVEFLERRLVEVRARAENRG